MKDKALYFSGWLLMVAVGLTSVALRGGRSGVTAQRLAVAGSAGVVSKPADLVPKEEAGRVVRVVDGDTYDVRAGGVTYRVRLLAQRVPVDAPEPDQPFGHLTADSVARLLAAGRPVLLTRRGTDLYGRTLGAVRLPVAGQPALALDSLLVVRGWAWAWEPQRRVAGRAAQQAVAVAAGRGLWKCGPVGVLTPRQWRKFNYKNKRRYGVGCTW